MARRKADQVEGAVPPAMGRRPAQKRSLARVRALLDAADALLLETEISQISLYDIARKAQVPPTSVYHFFPTREAVFVALAARYLEALHRRLDVHADVQGVETWVELISIRYRAVVAHFNESLPARKLFFGCPIGSDVRAVDFANMNNLARWSFESLNSVFEMPYIPDPVLKFSVLFGIYDGIWAMSYANYGYITPEYEREGLRAGVAYLSTFLPATLGLRPPGALVVKPPEVPSVLAGAPAA